MAGNLTEGYDLVLELNEQVLNDLLPAEPFPPRRQTGVELPFGEFTIGFDYDVFFPSIEGTSVVELDPTIANGLAISTGFSMELSNLSVSPPLPLPLPERVAINGTIRVLHALSTYDDSLGRCSLGMDFSTLPLDRVEVDVTSTSGLPLPEGGTERVLEGALHSMLRNGIGQLSIYSQPLPEDDDELVPETFDVRVVGTQCVALLISTTAATTGNASAFDSCHISPGADSAVIVSGHSLLMHLICPGLVSGLGLDGTAAELFRYGDGAAELIGPARLDHLLDHALVDAITLESMRIAIGDGSLTANGSVNISGFGYRASADLTAWVALSVDDDGTLVVDYGYDVVDVDLFIYPWVWILIALGIAVVPVIGGIVAIVLPILPFIVEPVAEAIVDHFLGAEGELEVLPSLPIEIDAVVLDDLMFTGRAIVADRAPAPAPSLWIESEIESTDMTALRSRQRKIAGAVYEIHTTVGVGHELAYRAETERMVYPVSFSWWLDGHALEGDGSIEIADVNVGYSVDGPLCQLSVGHGDSLDALLEVHGVPSVGSECTAEAVIHVEGTVELRTFTGVELLEGPSVLGLLQSLESPAAAALDLPVGPYVDDTPAWSVLVANAEVPASSAVWAEQRAALGRGTGHDIPPHPDG